MKHIILLISIIIASLSAYSQYKLKGQVKNEFNQPVAGASVSIRQKNNQQAAVSDTSGNYAAAGLHSGATEIFISAVGYKSAHEWITVSGNSEYNLILLSEPGKLQAVEVMGRSSKKYNSDYSFSATRTAILNKELPQSIGTVTKELIKDRQAFQLADAVKVIPGVIQSSYYNQYAIRGISQNEEGQIINGMRTRQYYFLQPLTANIERVEVLKGPASATFASVDPGGSINLVTKKPLAFNRREVSLSAGSFGTIRGTMDFTGPLDKEKKLLYRINGAYQQAQSYRDLVQNNALLISPSFSFIPNEKTAINVEVIYSDMEGNLDRGQPIFGAVAGKTDLRSTPISLNLGSGSDFFRSKDFTLTTSLTHKFNDVISFNAAYMKQTWREDLQEHRTTNAYAVNINNEPVTSLVGMQFVQRQQHWSTDNVNAYFNFRFATGKVKHELLAGYDLSNWRKMKGGGQNSARGFLLQDGSVANSFVPANAANYQTITYNGQTLPRPNVNYFDLSNPSYVIRNISDYSLNARTAIPSALTTTSGLYVQEQLRWNKLIVLLGLRQEWFEDVTNYKSTRELSFTNKKLLPRIGVTYSVTDQINVYGTYLQGYQPQSNTVTLLPSTGNYFWTDQSAARFKPLISDLKEAGAKGEFFNGKLNVNLALYEINQKNLLMNANLPDYPDSMVTRGAERSRGFEVDITGYLLSNWQIFASYSYIDARIIEDNNPALKGARKQNTPLNSASLWTRYNFTDVPLLKDLGLGLGVQHSGDRLPWFDRSFKTPAYTLLDIAAYYTPGKSNMQIAINVNNVLNSTWWIGAQNYQRLFPGAPRNATLTATYTF
ncbi:TonB-dependent siderophore receptor [Chitinophaga rhizophila]|uniref:TonB-dependent receptor n=1 Tax=Chitinophaga rhizophila TaxID=2866212 RepID=A0ABS7GAG0_9BACT|nr:TonB-dependent siderophore receptor [Chitinophaga rhizophila]MBW8684653.1 TonB-dependent receptor [Chitinophaga rhizophila]